MTVKNYLYDRDIIQFLQARIIDDLISFVFTLLFAYTYFTLFFQFQKRYTAKNEI